MLFSSFILITSFFVNHLFKYSNFIIWLSGISYSLLFTKFLLTTEFVFNVYSKTINPCYCHSKHANLYLNHFWFVQDLRSSSNSTFKSSFFHQQALIKTNIFKIYFVEKPLKKVWIGEKVVEILSALFHGKGPFFANTRHGPIIQD